MEDLSRIELPPPSCNSAILAALTSEKSVINIGPLPILALALLAFLSFDYLLGPRKYPREPPYIPSKIPLVGHILGLMKEKNHYYTKLCQQYGHRVYSLAMATGRLYVISQPNLVAEMQRIPKKISLWVIEAPFTARLGGMSKASAELMTQDDNAILAEGLKAIHGAMVPDKLAPMLTEGTRLLTQYYDTLRQECETREFELWTLLKRTMTVATTNAPGQRRWLLLIARKGYYGRERLVAAFQQYFTTDGAESGSELTRARARTIQAAFGTKTDDCARFEAVNGMALLSNTVPTAFWTCFHVLSSPTILAQVRAVVAENTTTEESTGERTTHLRTLIKSPLFESLVRESLRFRTTGIGPRVTTEDVSLGGGQYLLKKDAVVIIPNYPLHHDAAVWGSDAGKYHDQRFTPEGKAAGPRVPPATFRGFGCGATLCPGRHFATAQIAALLSMLVSKFDVKPVDGGEWREPGQNMQNMSLTISPPKEKIMVKITPKEEGDKWRFEM